MGNPLIEKYGKPKTSNPLIAKYGTPRGVDADSGDAATPELKALGKIVKYGGGAMADLAGRALDYPGGLARTAVASLGQLASDKNIVSVEDWINAAKGKAPLTAEYLQRGGVPELGKAEIPNPTYKAGIKNLPEGGVEYTDGGWTDKPVDVTGRGTIGLAGDVGSNMLAAGALAKVLKSGGKALYNSAFSKADELASQAGKRLPSEIFYEAGATPITKKGVLDDLHKILSTKSKVRSEIIDEVAATGQRGSGLRPLLPGEDVINRLRANSRISPETLEVLPSLENDLMTRKSLGEAPAIPPEKLYSQAPSPIVDESGKQYMNTIETTTPGTPERLGPTIKELNQAKTATGQTVSDSSFKAFNTGGGDQYKKAIAGGYKQEAERLADEAIPGKGTALRQANSDMSSLLTMLAPAERESLAAEGKHGITQIDAILAALEPAGLAAKQFGKASTLPGARTIPGYYGSKLGEAMGNFYNPKSIWDKVRLSND